MSDSAAFHSWLEEEETRLSRLRGQALLEGRWSLAQLVIERDPDTYVEQLLTLLHEASHEGRFDYKLRAFTELRRLYASSERFAYLRDDVLWYFKWIVGIAPEHVDVPAVTISTLLDDMEQWYLAEKESLKPVYMYRCSTALTMGQKHECEHWRQRWQAEPKGKTDDCPACEAALLVQIELDRRNDAAALKLGEYFYNYDHWCDATPDSVSWLIGPAMRLGHHQIAQWAHESALRDVRHRPGMLGALGSHLVYCGYLGQNTRARRLALSALRKSLTSGTDRDRFFLYRAVTFWCVLASLQGHQNITLPARLIPGVIPSTGEAHAPAEMNLIEVSQRMIDAATDIARRFDARNQTSRYSDMITQDHASIRKTIESHQKTPS